MSTPRFYGNVSDSRLYVPLLDIVRVAVISIGNTLTPVLAFTSLGLNWEDLYFAFFNDSVASTWTATIDFGDDGVAADAAQSVNLVVPVKSGSVPGQAAWRVDKLRPQYVRVSGISATGTVSARWLLRGVPR